MPFGLTNAPATFQRTLDIHLSPFKWRSCLVFYLDDVIVFSKPVEEHFAHLDAILSAVKVAGISLKLSKCSFFTNTVKYLGHLIEPGTLEVDETQLSRERNTHQLKQSCGPSWAYEMSIAALSLVTRTSRRRLTPFCERDNQLNWNPSDPQRTKHFAH